MPEAQTQTEHKPARDAEMERLRAQIVYLKHALAYADNESMRKRSESAAMEELVQCQRRVVQLHGYNKKLARLVEVLSKRLGITTVKTFTLPSASTPTPTSASTPAPLVVADVADKVAQCHRLAHRNLDAAGRGVQRPNARIIMRERWMPDHVERLLRARYCDVHAPSVLKE